MARILCTTFGSYGDLYPYLSVGCELQALGHEVCLATSASFRDKVARAGLQFAPVRPDVSLDDQEMMRYLFDRRRGTERVVRALMAETRATYEDILPLVRAADVVLTHPITFVAVVAVEQLRRRWVSSVLAPISFLSAHDPPIPAPMPWLAKLRVFGPGVMRAVWNTGKRVSLEWTTPVKELRREVGLGTGAHPLFEGTHSPELVLALFSRLFAEPQPDWPAQTILTGFPFYGGGQQQLAPELAAFLEAGSAPVVFTLGSSAVGAAGDFYGESLQAVQRLGVRAVFLTGGHAQELPESLPKGVLAWPYAPHAQVFARAAAVVHQGGIGTTAQALRAGKPMLVVPFAHDQFDNAERVRRMGVATVTPRGRYSERTAHEALKSLLGSAAHADAARTVGEAIRAENGAETAARTMAEWIARG